MQWKRLNEALRAELHFSSTAGGQEVAAARFDVECLLRLHWGGMATMGLIAAFCMPNDPAVDRVLKSASEALRKAGKPDEINGVLRQRACRVIYVIVPSRKQHKTFALVI